MNKDINVAEILKTKEKGIKLYDTVRDIDVYLYNIIGENDEIHCSLEKDGSKILAYSYNGTLPGFVNGMMVLVPSREMQDWEKFQWKKGDVLCHNTYPIVVMFDSFINDDYTKFKFNYKLGPEQYDMSTDSSERFTKVSEQEAKSYIIQIETEYNVKLNNEISESEKTHTEFKDGDILSCDEDTYTKHTTLILHKNGCVVESLASLIRHRDLVESCVPINEFLLSRLYYARETEKKELFDALRKNGKIWDSKMKRVVDLKTELKPFDKVLVRDDKEDLWFANIFSYQHRDMYHCLGECYRYCIPYKGNERLLGTADDVSEKH